MLKEGRNLEMSAANIKVFTEHVQEAAFPHPHPSKVTNTSITDSRIMCAHSVKDLQFASDCEAHEMLGFIVNFRKTRILYQPTPNPAICSSTYYN